MNRVIIVCGIGTDVGKTLVSAILVEALKADYWKPIQCSHENHSDSQIVQQLTSHAHSQFHPEAYRLHYSLSPHHAARLEGLQIDLEKIRIPLTENILIIEGAGGLMVPLTQKILLIDVFASWPAEWILVSRHYLGSINHTLLSFEILRQRGISIKGIIFNGNENKDTEQVILNYTQLPYLGRLNVESEITKMTVKYYADQWKNHL